MTQRVTLTLDDEGANSFSAFGTTHLKTQRQIPKPQKKKSISRTPKIFMDDIKIEALMWYENRTDA
jgi:hypothetical protein